MSPRDATLQGDVGGAGPGHRHRADPGGGVHPGGVHGRHHRPPLPAVRAHHRRLGAHLGVQRAHAQPGAGGACCCGRSGQPRGLLGAARARLQPWLRRASPTATSPSTHAWCASSPSRCCSWLGVGGAVRRARPQAAVGLRARRGQRLRADRRAAARRGVAAAHQGGVQEGRGRSWPGAEGIRTYNTIAGFSFFTAHGRQLRRHRLHRSQAVGASAGDPS